jgi:Zinc carboxypeptidase
MKKHVYLILSIVLVAVFGFALTTQAEGLIDTYPDTERMYDEIRVMAKAYPDNVELIEYGKSVNGRPLLALRLHLNDGVKRPGGMVAANIHGEEWIGNRAAMAIAHRVVNGILIDDQWIIEVLSKMDIYVLPCLNPDGYETTSQSKGKAPFNEMRQNANSVDLNRNFPIPRGAKQKPENKKSVNNPGSAPLSEPETKSVVDFVLERDIIAAVDYHSVIGIFGTPSCYSLACFNRYSKMCWAHYKNQRDVHYFYMVIPAMFGREVFPNQMEPYLYHEHGVMAILVELGVQPVNMIQNRSKAAFETFNPKNPDFWAYNEAEAAIASLEAAHDVMDGKRVPPDRR